MLFSFFFWRIGGESTNWQVLLMIISAMLILKELALDGSVNMKYRVVLGT